MLFSAIISIESLKNDHTCLFQYIYINRVFPKQFELLPRATANVLSFFLSILSQSNFDHHLRCGGWLNFEFS